MQAPFFATPRVRLVKPDPPCYECLEGENFQSHLGNPYQQDCQVFIHESEEGKFDAYAYLAFDTPNHEGVVRTASGSLWKLDADTHFKQGIQFEDEVHVFPEGDVMHIVKCPKNIKNLLKNDKKHIAYLFIRNDLASFSSLTFGLSSKTCIEYYVIGMAKTDFNIACTVETSAEELHTLAMVSPRACPYMLAAVLSGEGNDTRFDYEIPAGLSKEELKLHKENALLGVRARLRTEFAPEQFKKAYLAWLVLNKTLPRDTDPEIIKNEVGGKLLMLPHHLPIWNKMAPLLFMLATTKHMQNNSKQLTVAATCIDAFIAEISPFDARYGIKPPGDKTRLDWTKTADGLRWMVKDLLPTHAVPQLAFANIIAEHTRLSHACLGPSEMAYHDGMVFDFLTTSMDQYRLQGLQGLGKSIALRTFLGSEFGGINLTEGVRARIKKFLSSYGISDFWLHECKIESNPNRRDPFDILRSIGIKPA